MCRIIIKFLRFFRKRKYSALDGVLAKSIFKATWQSPTDRLLEKFRV